MNCGRRMNTHPALQSAKSVIIPGAYNNLGLHCHGGDLNALNGGREEVNNSGRGGTLVQDAKDYYNQHIPEQYHSGIESLARAGAKDLGFGLYAGMNGNRGRSVVSDAVDFYNQKIPEQYHSGIESLARAGAKDLGFGLYAGQGRGMGGDIFEDMLDGLTEGGKKLLTFAPDILKMAGVPQLTAPINYLVDKFVADPNDEAGKSRRRAEEARNPTRAPFKADLPSVPRRSYHPLPPLPAVPKRDNYMKEKPNNFNRQDSYHRYDNNGQGMGVEDIADFKNQFENHMRNAYNQVPSQLHPAIESFGKSAMNSLGFGMGDYMKHLKTMMGKIAQHIPQEHHHHLENIGKSGMEHSLRKIGMGLNLGIEPIKDSNGERPMSLDWIGKHTGISGINDHMFGTGHCDGGNIFEDIGDTVAPWLEKTLRENNLGQEKDPLAFMYGGEVGDGLGAGKKPKMVKGSPEAKAYMASIRKKKGKKKMEGGELPPRSRSPITDPSLLGKG